MRTVVLGVLTGAAAVPGFVLLPFAVAVSIYAVLAVAGSIIAVRAELASDGEAATPQPSRERNER